MACLIDPADNIPQLETLIMEEGVVSCAGFTALAEAGRQGCLPHLKAFKFPRFDASEGLDVHGKAACIGLLRVEGPGFILYVIERNEQGAAPGDSH